MGITIESVKRKYEEQLMSLPNVTGVGVGEKAGKEVIVVFVTHKVRESALQPEEIVPKTVEGYETDVEEIGIVTKQTDIESVKRKYEEQLMSLPNVTGVGVGQKAGKEVIVVFVTHKVPESALQPEEIVPRTVEGYETDVEEIGVVTEQTE